LYRLCTPNSLPLHVVLGGITANSDGSAQAWASCWEQVLPGAKKIATSCWPRGAVTAAVSLRRFARQLNVTWRT